MKTIAAKIDCDSEAALKALLNSPTQTLLAPHADMDYGSSVIAVKHVSIGLAGERFVVLECDWDETAEGYDYYHLSARLADSPKDIKNQRGPGTIYRFLLARLKPWRPSRCLKRTLCLQRKRCVRTRAFGLSGKTARGSPLFASNPLRPAGICGLAEDGESLTSDLETRSQV